jgi:hypothetical protein
MFYSRFAVIAMVLALGACASSPRYVEADHADGYGHYTTRLAQDRYRIQFNGRRSTGRSTTQDYTLLRAADLTLEEGYDWFEIVARDTETTHTAGHQPATGFGYQRTYWVEDRCGMISCTRSVRPATYGSLYIGNERPETRYSHTLEIVLVKGAMPQTGGRYYDATSIRQYLWDAM